MILLLCSSQLSGVRLQCMPPKLTTIPSVPRKCQVGYAYIYNIYITYILYIFVCVCACVVCLHISEPLACLGPSEARRQRASDLPELVTDGFELPCTHVPLPLVEDPALNHWAISLAFLKHNAPKFHTSLLIPIWKVDPWSHWAKREARKYCSC